MLDGEAVNRNSIDGAFSIREIRKTVSLASASSTHLGQGNRRIDSEVREAIRERLNMWVVACGTNEGFVI